MSKAAELCQKAIQNELQNPPWEPPKHPLGRPCEHNFQFFQICSILGATSSQTEPRWVPKINKMLQKLVLETSSEKATRNTVFKDTFTKEFPPNLKGSTSPKHCYLLHGSHILTSLVLVGFVNFCCPNCLPWSHFCAHLACKSHKNAHQETMSKKM